MNVTNCRGSNFYVALYWAEELAARDKAWEPLAKALKDNEETIVKELIECQVKAFTFYVLLMRLKAYIFSHLLRLVTVLAPHF
jgi:monomeric isocitrate dehydrogenase